MRINGQLIRLSTLLVAVALLGLRSASAQDAIYRLYVLNSSESGAASKAYALNNTGQIVGWMASGDDHHSAHWHVETTTDLHGTVHFSLQHDITGYFNVPYHEAYDISNADQIVGTGRISINCPPEITVTNAYVLRPAVLTDLATPYAGDALTDLSTFGGPCATPDSAATGISNRNHVVGWSDQAGGVIRAFMSFENGGLVDLRTLRGDTDTVSAATAVTDEGVVTGYSYTLAQPAGAAGLRAAYHAFTVTPNDTNADGIGDQWAVIAADGSNNLMQDLGTLGGYNSWGRDINSSNQVVGESDTDPDDTGGNNLTRAFLWSNGVMTDLGGLVSDGFSAASGINDAGVIVGWGTNADGQRRAVIFQNGEVQDLNTLICLVNEDGTSEVATITLTEARDINEDGWIVGWGDAKGSSNTGSRGFLLIPLTADCPELAVVGGDTSNGNSGNAGGDGTGAGGNAIGGTPQNLGDGSSTTNGTTNGGGGAAAPAGLCGFGYVSMIPLTLVGCAAMKFINSRRCRRKG